MKFDPTQNPKTPSGKDTAKEESMEKRPKKRAKGRGSRRR